MKKMFKVAVCAIVALALILVPLTVSAESDYSTSKTKLVEGTNAYAVDTSVAYTVYILNPTDVGEFTITTTDGLIGIVSYLDMWVQFDPTDDIVNLDTIQWKCTDKNQSIMIAIKSDLAEASITVTRAPLDTSNEIEWTIYENTKSPEKFVMPEFVDVSAFDDGYVDFEDSDIDDAVLGDDGYYHLNEKNGPVLFANLNDSIMSLYGMSGYGRVAAIYYDDAGAVSKKVDYTDAFNQYVSALPSENGVISSYYYPLTDDLIEIFKEVGATHDWYSGTEAWVYESEDAWMFACYYDADVISMNPDDNKNNVEEDKNNNTTDNTTDNTTGNNDTNNSGSVNDNTNTDTADKSPATGDNIISIAISMLSAAAVVFITKK